MTATTSRIRIEFSADDHKYLLNGNQVPSVTTVMEAEGLSGCPFWKEEHRNRGTAVHKVALLLGKRPIRGSTVEEIVANSAWDPALTHPAIVPYGLSVARYYLESGLRPELVEQPVGSLKLQLCGTLDLLGRTPEGKRRLVDFKSGQPQPAADIQTALYATCLEETLGIKTDERTVVWLKPDTTYKQFPPRPAGGVDLSIGMCAVNLYHWRAANKKLG